MVKLVVAKFEDEPLAKPELLKVFHYTKIS